jgi:hypothetical protein
MARDFTGEIHKMIVKRELRRIATTTFSAKPGSGGSGVVLGNARVYRQSFSSVTTLTVTHNLGVIPLVFALVESSPYGIGAYGVGSYSLGGGYVRLDETEYTVAYASNACIVNFTSAQTGEIICIG